MITETLNTTLNSQITLSLVSGLVGSLIGGLVTFLVARYSIEKTSREAVAMESKKRMTAKKEDISKALSALETENNENLESVNLWNKHHRKFRFNTDAWSSNKPLVSQLDNIVQTALIKAYANISRHNTLIDYDLQVPHGLGSKDAEIERQIKETEEVLLELQKVLLV